MQINLSIPDNKVSFFMELINNLEFVKVSQFSSSGGLTAEQKYLTDIELKKAKEDSTYMLDFDTAWQDLNKGL